MPLWQDKLFIFLMKNAAQPTDFFKIPPGRVVETGRAGDGLGRAGEPGRIPAAADARERNPAGDTGKRIPDRPAGRSG